MKRIHLSLAAAFMAISLISVSCGSDDSKTGTASEKAKSGKSATVLPNYRYVDLDSVLSKYNLAKDYQEEAIRMQNNLESAHKRHQDKLQNFANSMQNKMQNNGYLTEASYRQDQQTLNNMQAEAEKSMGTMQANMANAAMQAQQAVIDSITSFIKDYNKKRGYDAIFQKASTLYINPELDITDEVVEGLNARYNKVKK